jgi:hypothetical protein
MRLPPAMRGNGNIAPIEPGWLKVEAIKFSPLGRWKPVGLTDGLSVAHSPSTGFAGPPPRAGEDL